MATGGGKGGGCAAGGAGGGVGRQRRAGGECAGALFFAPTVFLQNFFKEITGKRKSDAVTAQGI